MDKELLMIASMTSGGLLFSLGGYHWKWLRRFVLPCILGGLALAGGETWWKCLSMASLMIGSLCLPYGERTPYPVKFLVGCSFVAPTAFLGFSAWQIITPLAFILMFALSNWKPTRKVFFWKAVEFLTGALIGVTTASLI